jgi:formylglycine-generating enzyme required for sulfatase activity
MTRSYNHRTWQCNEGDVYDAGSVRLPTESEWEYACRAGSQTAFSNGEIMTDDGGSLLTCEDTGLDQVAWYCGNSGGRSHDVGTKPANDWGLFDLHGNVWEWCNDWYGDYDLGSELDPDFNPTGPDIGGSRVIRGGRWLLGSLHCRSGNRMMASPYFSGINIGFRVAMTVPATR